MGQDDQQQVARRQTYSHLGGGVLSRDKHSQDKVALVFGEDVWTRGRLFMAVERLTRGFAASGIGAGDRIVLHLRNRPEFILAYLACFRSGAIAVPINPRLKLAEVKPIPGARRACDVHWTERTLRSSRPACVFNTRPQ